MGLRIGTSSNYTAISSTDGTFTQAGEATTWDDIRVALSNVAATGIQPATLKEFMDSTGYPGAALGSSGVFLYHFAPNREEDITFSMQIPHRWEVGTDIHLHFHWIPKTNSTGNFRVGAEVGIAKLDQKYHQVAPASTHRESSGTTKKIWFGSAHGLRTYRQIVVASAGGTGYNGDNSSNNSTFTITDYSDTAPDYWIQYTGAASSTETKTADTGAVVTGYTYRLEATDTQAANTQGLHMIKELGDVKMDVHNSISTVLIIRLYRVANSGVSGGLNEDMVISDFDVHFKSDTLGSNDEYIK